MFIHSYNVLEFPFLLYFAFLLSVTRHPSHSNGPHSPPLKNGQHNRMVAYVPVSAHVPGQMSEPVKICAGCGGKMKLEDQRCPTCEPADSK